jgi:hypothetical protein
MKAIAPPELVRIEPTALEAGQEAPVCRVVAKEHADLVALHSRREKACGRIKLVLGLPEVADVVTRRREFAGHAEGNTALARLSIVKAPGPEEVEQSVSLRPNIFYLAAPELPKRAHDELHLRQVGATPRASPPVRVAALTVGRGHRTVQVGGDEFHQLPARHVGR